MTVIIALLKNSPFKFDTFQVFLAELTIFVDHEYNHAKLEKEVDSWIAKRGMSSSGRYIGNPLFEATGSGASSTQTTSKSSGFFQDISDSANASVNSTSARRQAFSFAYSADSDSAPTAETTSRHHLRNQHHLPFSLDSPLDGVATASSRYLGVPNSYSSNIEATRFSLDSLPHSSRESNKLSFSRHHSVDSPEHVRRSQFR